MQRGVALVVKEAHLVAGKSQDQWSAQTRSIRQTMSFFLSVALKLNTS
jgi:hypothetical protein